MASVGRSTTVVLSTSNLCDMTNSYKNNSTPRGYCLIINNEKFKDLPTREGSQKDVETLRQLFTDLGYEMWDTQANTSNLTAQEIKDVVKKFAASDKQNSVDSSIVAILSHGGAEDVIFGADDEKLSFSYDILRLFEGENAPDLMQKPKLFILQACRGDRRNEGICQRGDVHGGNGQRQEGTENVGVSSADTAPPAAHIQPDPSKPRKTAEKTKLLPTLSDYIVFRPTTPGVTAMRHRETGSWFINVLAEVFAAEAYWSNLDKLAHKVHAKMSAKQGREMVMNEITKKDQAEYRKQMAVCDNSLQKDFYFNPPPLTKVVGWGITLAYWHWSGLLDLIKDDLSSKLQAWNNKEMAGATVMPQLLMLYSQSCRLSEETNKQMTKLLDTNKKTVPITKKNLCGVREKSYFVSLNKRRCSCKDHYIPCDYPTCLRGLQLTDTNHGQRNNELYWFHITLQQILSKKFSQVKCPFVLVPFDDKKPDAVDATVREMTKLWREDKMHGFQLEDREPEWLKTSASLLDKSLKFEFQSWMPIGILLAQRWADLYFRNYGPELTKTVKNFINMQHEPQVMRDDDDDNDVDNSCLDMYETSDFERVHQGDGDTEIDASKMDWQGSSTDYLPVKKLLVLLPRTCKTFNCVSDDEKSVVAEKDMDHFPDSTKGIGQRLVGKSTVYKLEGAFFLAEYATPLRCLHLMMEDGIISEQLMDDFYCQFCRHLELWLERFRSFKESFSLVPYDDRDRNQALLYALRAHLTQHQQ